MFLCGISIRKKTKVSCVLFPYFSCHSLIIFWAFYHRSADGKLAHGKLVPWLQKCQAMFNVYTPQDLSKCPHVVIICHNLHSHPPPAPVKIPPAIKSVFEKLLYDMDWLLADATPHWLVLDSGFMYGLHCALGWMAEQTPMLSDLHPSLANLDHVWRLINTLHLEKYPHRTGFDGKSSFIVWNLF